MWISVAAMYTNSALSSMFISDGPLHVFEVLRRDLRDGDVVDVDLLLADQVQQQVERAVVVFQVKIQRGRHFYLEYQGRYLLLPALASRLRRPPPPKYSFTSTMCVFSSICVSPRLAQVVENPLLANVLQERIGIIAAGTARRFSAPRSCGSPARW